MAPSRQAVTAAAAGTDLLMLDGSHKGPQEAQLDGFQSRIYAGARGSNAEQQQLYTTEWQRHEEAVSHAATAVAVIGSANGACNHDGSSPAGRGASGPPASNNASGWK